MPVAGGEITLFRRPLPPGWIYPCTLEDLLERLSLLPCVDLAGLRAVGLVPSTRKDCTADARYFSCPKPVIEIYSRHEGLSYRQPPHVRRHDVESGMAVEIGYGMSVRLVGSRWTCEWELADLRNFILSHVLLHEIGHHVCHMHRPAGVRNECPGTGVCEQFAESYALRMSRRAAGCPMRNG